jgi:glycosyltransferase involved in cell wall biosynthesis
MRLSFIVPFHRDLASLGRCLAGLATRPRGSEVIVAADGARDDCRQTARDHGARVISIDGPRGPAVARNVAAAAASGDVLVFIDADVVVSRPGLARLVRLFQDDPSLAAAFGSYDDLPAHPGFVSQYKNLSHAFVHRASAARTRTFWAGFGAVRRQAFEAVGGFDERFTRPSVEDIDLGYRLTEAGYAVVIDPAMAACHLKKWTLAGTIVSDVRDRGIPWTQLVMRYGVRRDHLNLSAVHRWSVVLAYLAVLTAMLALYARGFLLATAAALVAIVVLNHAYYRFFYRARGRWFAARVWPVHVIHHLCNGLSFLTGAVLFVGARWLGLLLPHTVPIHPWSASCSLRRRI